MKHYQKGKRFEYKTRDILKRDGYDYIMSAGSKGLWDIAAWNDVHLRLIQVKANRRPTKKEFEKLAKALVFDLCSKEVWIWWDYKKLPNIMFL